MIVFNCPHCGNTFRVPDELAGRDGWCRVCKRMIFIRDQEGLGPGLNDLPLEEKYDRLDRLMQFAASRADGLKLLLGEYRDEQGKLISSKLVRRENNEHESIVARLEAAESENKKIRADLTESYTERDALKTNETKLEEELTDAQARIEDTEPTPTISTLEESLKKAEKQIETLAWDLDQECTERSRVEVERDSLSNKVERLRTDLEAVSETRDKSELQQSELAKTIERLEDDLAEGTNRLDELLQETVELKKELEASTEAKEEVVSLTEELSELEVEYCSERKMLRDQLAETRAVADQLQQEIDAFSVATPDLVHDAQAAVSDAPVATKNGTRSRTVQSNASDTEVGATSKDRHSEMDTKSPKERRKRLRALEESKTNIVAEKRGDGRGYSLEGMRFATLLSQLQALQAIQGLGEMSTDDNAPGKRLDFSKDAIERANQYQWLTFKADWLDSLLEDTIDKLEALVSYEQELNALTSEDNSAPSKSSLSAE